MTLNVLRCTVRNCLLPLEERGRSFVCANNHSFDRARSGYVNLLQPQDRRSRVAGDRPEAVAARRRLFEWGYGQALREHLRNRIPSGARVLDVGCGEGSHLGMLQQELSLEAHGVDLSVDAIELAAKRYKQPLFVVANADRALPYLDDSFDVVLSITARRHEEEFARTLRPDGRVVVVVPAADDLIELRELAQGERVEAPRTDVVVSELAGRFCCQRHDVVRAQRRVDAAVAADLLAATYRGARRSEQERLRSVEELDCTMSWDVLEFVIS